MSDAPDTLDQQLAALEAALKLPLPAATRTQIEQDLRALREHQAGQRAGAGAAPTTGTTNISGTVRGAAVGVNYGTIQAFFGGAATEHGETLLLDYLVALEQDCQRLHLARLTGRRQTGAEQRAAPTLRLQEVYTSLTTDGPMVVVHQRERPVQRVQRLVAWFEQHPRGSADVEPRLVRELRFPVDHMVGSAVSGFQLGRGIRRHDAGPNATVLLPEDVNFEAADSTEPIRFTVTRPELALETICTQWRLVLLGEPGHGKSTVLRYLALLLAHRLRGAPIDLPEWPVDDTPIPILLPLGQVAAALAQHGGDARTALWQVLGDVLEGPEGLRAGLRAHLKPAVRAGAVLLFCDGLDELPAEGARGGVRARVAAALRGLADGTQARMVVTSRVLPYRAAADWQLPAEEGWRERTIQPLAFGQVRAFVRGWYHALADATPELALAEARDRAEFLITELEQNERLRPLVQSPLLLTMLAILHANSREGEIPRERVRLYDECVQLLLERWEPVRTPGLQRPGLLERLGNLPGLEIDKLRDVIHELAFQAHDQPPDDDGRGRIDRHRLSGRLLEFFTQLRSSNPAGNITTLLEVVRAEAGLLIARDDQTAYTFPHLTFQEFLAACWLADQPTMDTLAYARWCGDDRERWRTVLLLLAGRLRQKGQKDVERDGVPWLQALAGATAHGCAKPPTQRRRDAVLAALSYAELGGRAALVTSMRDLVRLVEEPLRTAIINLLETPDAAITTIDRIAAARVLADLGDPRVPITIDDWRAELARRNEHFAAPVGYWCYVRPGTYRIGGWEKGEPDAKITLPAFWIARFPITVAQYAPFVDVGYGRKAKHWWTSKGWAWKQGDPVTKQPWGWDDPDYRCPNQPVFGVTWYEATAFCAWLTAQFVDNLPAGYVVRLPTEAEWEAAAAYDAARHRRNYPWGKEEPTPERAIYDAGGLGHPVPVGCCPAGVAACGALDMAGNVWEVTTSRYRGYPEQSNAEAKDFTTDEWDVPWRGGSYYQNSTFVRCGARGRDSPHDDFYLNGFRVVVAPRSH